MLIAFICVLMLISIYLFIKIVYLTKLAFSLHLVFLSNRSIMSSTFREILLESPASQLVGQDTFPLQLLSSLKAVLIVRLVEKSFFLVFFERLRLFFC